MTTALVYRYRVRVDILDGRTVHPLAVLMTSTGLPPPGYIEALAAVCPGLLDGQSVVSHAPDRDIPRTMRKRPKGLAGDGSPAKKKGGRRGDQKA